MPDSSVGDLYVWCRPAFEQVVGSVLASLYPGEQVHVSPVLGLTMFRVSVSVPQGPCLDILNVLLMRGAGAIVYSWFESVSYV